MQTSYLLAALSLVVTGESFFDFYKLSLQWPPSACSVKGKSCISPIPKNFTIHGLWPQYANDTQVKPYKDDPSCTTVTPTKPNRIIVQLQPILSDLNDSWPNLYLDEQNQTDNPMFWRCEWSSHGMCSDYPNNSLAYFNKTLQLSKQYNPLQVEGIQPGDVYRVKFFVRAIFAKWNVKPQIACYRLNATHNLLKEIRLCFNRPHKLSNKRSPLHLRDCPNTVASCASENGVVIFPLHPLSTSDIIRE